MRRGASQLNMFCDDADDVSLEGFEFGGCQHLCVSPNQPVTYSTISLPMASFGMSTRSLQNANIDVEEAFRVQVGFVWSSTSLSGAPSNLVNLYRGTSGNKATNRLC